MYICFPDPDLSGRCPLDVRKSSGLAYMSGTGPETGDSHFRHGRRCGRARSARSQNAAHAFSHLLPPAPTCSHTHPTLRSAAPKGLLGKGVVPRVLEELADRGDDQLHGDHAVVLLPANLARVGLARL